MQNYFKQLTEINVADQVQLKGTFCYLSWPYAVAQLRLADPTATWEVKRFNGLPYLATDLGYFVEVAVSVQGVTLSQIHPVLDNKNRPIPAPNAFDINTSIQRCLVKAIALHGLALNIYMGEDLPEGSRVEKLSEAQQATIRKKVEEVNGNLDRLLTYFKVERLADIPAADYDRVLRSLENKARRAA